MTRKNLILNIIGCVLCASVAVVVAILVPDNKKPRNNGVMDKTIDKELTLDEIRSTCDSTLFAIYDDIRAFDVLPTSYKVGVNLTYGDCVEMYRERPEAWDSVYSEWDAILFEPELDYTEFD